MVGEDLSVSETAAALGASPQTVRTLLRKGELPGRKEPWGSRYVWVASRAGVDAFLAEHGRLDGQRRRPQPVSEPAPEPTPEQAPEPAPERAPEPTPEPAVEPAGDTLTLVEIAPSAVAVADTRPFVL